MDDDLEILDSDEEPEDITDYDGVLTEVLTDCINAESDEPMVVVNWILIADCRLQDHGYTIAVKTPRGMPWWISEGLLEQASIVSAYGDDDDD